MLFYIKDVEKKVPSCTMVGKQTDSATMKVSVESPQKNKNRDT